MLFLHQSQQGSRTDDLKNEINKSNEFHLVSEAYLKHSRTSMMELFVKINNDYKQLTIAQPHPIIDVRLGC